MRVLLWAGSFLPRIGGVEMVVDRLVRTLGSRGIEFRIVAPAEAGAPAEDVHAGTPVYRFPFQDALAAQDIAGISRLRRRVAELKASFEPDLVHIHAFHPGLLFHLETASVSAARSILTLHDWPALSYGPETVPGRVVRTADRVVACSEATLALARRAVPEIGRVASVILNGVPAPTVRPAPLPFDPPRILYLGRLVPRKGVDRLVDAVASLSLRWPAARLVIAGDGAARADLERRVAARGLAARTEFAGWIPPGEVPALINRSTLVVVPSVGHEDFGLVAAEAARMARPVVATRVGGLPEVVRHGRTGFLVPDGDREALAGAIATLLECADTATRLGQAARRRAGRQFSWSAYARKYLALYHSFDRGVTRG
jgi:glycogen(starch) synthase